MLDKNPMQRLLVIAYLIGFHMWLISYYLKASETSPEFLG